MDEAQRKWYEAGFHEMRWKRVPQGLVKATPWGYQASCKCGWEQEGLAGSKSFALKEYYAHKNLTNED